MDRGEVSSFWNWFAEESAVLSFLCSSGDLAQARSLVNEQLNKIGPGLRWEISAGYRAKYRFSIIQRPDDDARQHLAGEELMASAPDRMQTWEFCLMVFGSSAAHPNTVTGRGILVTSVGSPATLVSDGAQGA
jgi:hypothetical protein